MQPDATMTCLNHTGARPLVCLLLAALFLAFMPRQSVAQQTCSDVDGTRTCVVDPGFGTMNAAIQGDTTATGDRVDPNTVYVLQRGQLYLLNGTVDNPGYHLHIKAEEGDGHPPIVQPGVDITGSASRAFEPRGDMTVEGFYIHHIDDAGSLQKNMFRIKSDGVRIVADRMFLDYDQQSFFRIDSDSVSIFLTDSHLRNSVLLSNPNNGRIIDTRGNTPDTLYVENNTMYNMGADVIRDDTGILPYLFFNHNTVVNAGDRFEVERAIKAIVTNNVFVNGGAEPKPPNSLGLPADFVDLDTLNVEGLTEADRIITFRNNVYSFSQAFLDYYASVDTVEARPFLNSAKLQLIADNPGMTLENLLTSDVPFTDPPDDGLVADFWREHIVNPNNENPPDFRADKSGVFGDDGFPTPFIGELPYDFDFSYSTSAEAYTAADGGFPLGDLNWFPDKKAEWEAQMTTAVDDVAELPDGFRLLGNFPNPFNPSTTIRFELPWSANVEIAVFDLLGRRVLSVPAQPFAPGAASVRLDASSLASGMYLYRVTAETNSQIQFQTGRMVLVK